jgi:hypothetical protein
LPHGLACLNRLSKLSPGVHEMVMMHNDMTDVFLRIFDQKRLALRGVGISVLLFGQESHSGQGIEKRFYTPYVGSQLMSNFICVSSFLTYQGEDPQPNTGM